MTRPDARALLGTQDSVLGSVTPGRNCNAAAARRALPFALPGNRIGLFGGSFNPPHSGHRLVAETALRRLALDQVWWLVTPGNPLKSKRELTALDARMRAVAAMAAHPAMNVTDVETHLGSSFTAHTLAALRRLRPDLRFVWIMGADNLHDMHKWRRWKDILTTVPVAIVDRPGVTLSSLSAPAARAFARRRLKERAAQRLADCVPPAWVFLHTRHDPASSTALRRAAAQIAS